MDENRSGTQGLTFDVEAYRERLTILPPPPSVSIPDPRAPRDRAIFIPELGPELGEEALHEPTDVDSARWWGEEDDEDAVITERSPRLRPTTH